MKNNFVIANPILGKHQPLLLLSRGSPF